MAGCHHYAFSDRPLFIAAYNELCRFDLTGKRVLEICCGGGDLAMQMARAFPGAQIIAMDRYPEAAPALRDAIQNNSLPNASYMCGDAFHLTQVPDSSIDLLYGQATLHHLAHETTALAQESARVLKPGGRLIFIYEPFGHNPFVSMIRAYRISRAQMVDESNVFLSQLSDVAKPFAKAEIQIFNFLGYPLKGLGRIGGQSMAHLIYRLDAAVMSRWRGLALMGANFNAIFTK